LTSGAPDLKRRSGRRWALVRKPVSTTVLETLTWRPRYGSVRHGRNHWLRLVAG
jgi:hypothetical protein